MNFKINVISPKRSISALPVVVPTTGRHRISATGNHLQDYLWNRYKFDIIGLYKVLKKPEQPDYSDQDDCDDLRKEMIATAYNHFKAE